MPSENRPQIYLQTPMLVDVATLPDLLASMLDTAAIACLRLTTAALVPDDIRRLCDAVSPVAQSRDIPVVIDTHYRLVQPLGLDGVHLTDGLKHIREARNLLGPEGIVGAFCGTSRHAGMTAAEMTADYIGFGPMQADPLLGDGEKAPRELFAWWSDMIEVPVVAEGAISLDLLDQLADCADFVCLGQEVWQHRDGPVSALRGFAERLR